MRKMAVVFPGIGYTKDRPLLYYAGKQAVACGYELIHVNFTGLKWTKEKLKDHDFMVETLDKCLSMTEETLAGIGDMTGDNVVFISKSIGTVVATAYAEKRSINAKQICFSPLEQIEPYIREKSGILFYGDNDPLADYRAIEDIAHKKALDMYRISGGNHSLETGDPCKDIENLKPIIVRIKEMLYDI